jgi:hypothetical protein
MLLVLEELQSVYSKYSKPKNSPPQKWVSLMSAFYLRYTNNIQFTSKNTSLSRYVVNVDLKNVKIIWISA